MKPHDMLNIKFEVEDTIRKILRVIYGFDDSHLELASKSVMGLVKAEIYDTELVDSLTFDDASLVCACLEKSGFRDGRDYGVYQCGARYGIMIKRGCSSIADHLLQDLQGMRIVWRIASTILREWRYIFDKCSGDVYEALYLAYRVIVMRNRLSNRRCPSYGRISGAIVKGAVHGRSYSIYARKVCCNHRAKIVLGL